MNEHVLNLKLCTLDKFENNDKENVAVLKTYFTKRTRFLHAIADQCSNKRYKEVIMLVWSACPHDSQGNRIKNERHTDSEIR